MVRRLKSEIENWDGSPLFPKRELEALEVDYPDEEKAVHAALQSYTRSRRENATSRAETFATEFVLKLLKKRLFSSAAAFASTLAQHERSLRESRKRSAGQPKIQEAALLRDIDRAEEDYADDAEMESAADDALQTASLLFRPPTADEERLLQQMRNWAATASARCDAKAAALVDWLKNYIRPNGMWSSERVIIFTEYRATQNWLQTILVAHGLAGGDRLLTLNGSTDLKERERVKAAFQYDPALSPVRILLATDAASEGIDLQNHCSRLIHNEIPWNPNRMEQRNGRIDRHGQRAKEVNIYHFVAKGYKKRQQNASIPVGDLEADLEFLMRAAIKVNTIREDLGKVGPVIARKVEEAMLSSARKTLDIDREERDAEPVRKLLRFERNVREQIQRFKEQLQETQRELRLSPGNIEHVVRTALELAGQPALVPARVEGVPDGSAFHLPPLRGSWALAAEGNEHPHTHERRPIVFDNDLIRGRDDLVLIHLNHRLAQMSMGLLRAEVWSIEGRKKIHRVTARIVPDEALDSPAVIAHARLVVVGGDSRRLHEELITAGGIIREGRFARLNVGQVRDALAAALPDQPADEVKDRLRQLWSQHAPSLIQSLEARMKDRTAGLEKALTERADKDVSDITAIMKELEASIEAELDAPEDPQMPLFSDPERDQYDRNIDSLRARVQAIPGELQREIAAIRERFADPQPRLFPVAITYLVPERHAGRKGGR